MSWRYFHIVVALCMYSCSADKPNIDVCKIKSNVSSIPYLTVGVSRDWEPSCWRYKMIAESDNMNNALAILWPAEHHRNVSKNLYYNLPKVLASFLASNFSSTPIIRNHKHGLLRTSVNRASNSALAFSGESEPDLDEMNSINYEVQDVYPHPPLSEGRGGLITTLQAQLLQMRNGDTFCLTQGSSILFECRDQLFPSLSYSKKLRDITSSGTASGVEFGSNLHSKNKKIENKKADKKKKKEEKEEKHKNKAKIKKKNEDSFSKNFTQPVCLVSEEPSGKPADQCTGLGPELSTELMPYDHIEIPPFVTMNFLQKHITPNLMCLSTSDEVVSAVSTISTKTRPPTLLNGAVVDIIMCLIMAFLGPGTPTFLLIAIVLETQVTHLFRRVFKREHGAPLDKNGYVIQPSIVYQKPQNLIYHGAGYLTEVRGQVGKKPHGRSTTETFFTGDISSRFHHELETINWTPVPHIIENGTLVTEEEESDNRWAKPIPTSRPEQQPYCSTYTLVEGSTLRPDCPGEQDLSERAL